MLRALASAMAGAMVATVFISAHAAYDQLAHEGRINRNASTEVLKVHATIAARIDVALGQPDLPEMGVSDFGPKKVITIDPDGRVRSVG
jgi:hypothetical protein